MVVHSEISSSPDLSPIDHLLVEVELEAHSTGQRIPWYSREPFGGQRVLSSGAIEETSRMDANEIFGEPARELQEPQATEPICQDEVFERNFRELVFLLDGDKTHADDFKFSFESDVPCSTSKPEPYQGNVIPTGQKKENDVKPQTYEVEEDYKARRSVKEYNFEEIKMEPNIYSKKRRKNTLKRPRSSFSDISDQCRSQTTNRRL